jgi:PTH1 family peptidyl-tRNA hydrolase
MWWRTSDRRGKTPVKLIVGLGNPGRKYAETRHNIGFSVIAGLAGRHGQGRTRSKFHAEYLDADIDGQRAVLLCPQTYMNRSGLSVREACDFFQVPTGDLLVICDDFNLPLAKLRFRSKGSAGGQKGLQDVIRCLGTDQFSRLRIGIGAPPEKWEITDFVLSRFSADEAKWTDQAVSLAVTAVADWCREGTAYCMNQYNSRDVGEQ